MTKLLTIDVMADVGTPTGSRLGSSILAAAVLQDALLRAGLVSGELIGDAFADPILGPQLEPLLRRRIATERRFGSGDDAIRGRTFADVPDRDAGNNYEEIVQALAAMFGYLAEQSPSCLVLAGDHDRGLLRSSGGNLACVVRGNEPRLEVFSEGGFSSHLVGQWPLAHLLGESGLVVGFDNSIGHPRHAAPWLVGTDEDDLGPLALGWLTTVHPRDSYLLTEDGQDNFVVDRSSFLYQFVDGLLSLANETVPHDLPAFLPSLRRVKRLREQVALLWGQAMLRFHPDRLDRRGRRYWVVAQRLWTRAGVADAGQGRRITARTAGNAETVRLENYINMRWKPRSWSTRTRRISAELANRHLELSAPVGRLRRVGVKIKDPKTGKLKSVKRPEPGNVLADVRRVANMLRALKFGWVPDFDEDTTVDAAKLKTLIEVIRLFQAIVVGATSFKRLDGRKEYKNNANFTVGRIAKGDHTHKWLVAANAPQWKELEKDGPGFYNLETTKRPYGGPPPHYYAATWMQEVITGAGARFETEHRHGQDGISRITINDASPEHGFHKDSVHGSHKTGLNIDLRLAELNGNEEHPPMVWSELDRYDSAAMRAQLQAFWAQEQVQSILFNDPVLIAEGLCAHWAGHDNHLHLTIRPTDALPPPDIG